VGAEMASLGSDLVFHVVASRDGTIRIFNLDTDNTKRICTSTRNVLTEQRWSQVLPSLPYKPPCE
jgi:hypothetical protein